MRTLIVFCALVSLATSSRLCGMTDNDLSKFMTCVRSHASRKDNGQLNWLQASFGCRNDICFISQLCQENGAKILEVIEGMGSSCNSAS
ncbi:unnamed protein product [Ixodes persulcatus]